MVNPSTKFFIVFTLLGYYLIVKCNDRIQGHSKEFLVKTFWLELLVTHILAVKIEKV